MNKQGFLRLLALLVAGPIVALYALDRAVVLWPAHWQWVAREVPPLLLDPYRLEGLLRATPADPHNVVILGNSVAEAGFDAALLETRFAGEGLRFPKVTLGGAPALSFGMIADEVAALEPRAAVLVLTPPSLRSDGDLDHVYTYDVRAVPALFELREVLAEPRFHIDGLVGQLHVFARHRNAMRKAALVRLGQTSWLRLKLQADLVQLRHMLGGDDAWQSWVRRRSDDVYPNANTRAIERLAQRLRERGAKLYVFDAPVHPMAHRLGARKRVGPYREQLRELSARAGFELIPSERMPALEPDDFADFVHANERGRARLTAFLGDVIAERVVAYH